MPFLDDIEEGDVLGTPNVVIFMFLVEVDAEYIEKGDCTLKVQSFEISDGKYAYVSVPINITTEEADQTEQYMDRIRDHYATKE